MSPRLVFRGTKQEVLEASQRIAALEAELAGIRKLNDGVQSSLRAVASQLATERDVTLARAVKAEAEGRKCLQGWHDAEAEVERLKEDMRRCGHHWIASDHEGGERESVTPGGGTSPSGVSPSPPLGLYNRPDCDLSCCEGEDMKHAKGHYPHPAAKSRAAERPAEAAARKEGSP